ncbi:uncharacterized protein IUM83_08172 [Phytophthora cinnamomi]|uniref:uncharacterized protein n=1 Tax=Phytophthora cinnamomi TaxID=4785 RepID=UPI00355A3AA1|nr:hypothetical protein IUM83_08172 [Phytophthora cinnamomi]
MPSSSSSPGGPRGRVAQRRGSSAEAALQAEVARLGVPDGVLKRGFLVKKGHVLPTRKERYFVLGLHSLSYYKPTRDGDVELKGVLELKASDVISPLPHSDVWLRVRQIEGPRGKSYKLDLKASSLQDRREWIESLRKACRGELLVRQRARQSDVRLVHAQSSRRGQNAKAMAELLSAPLSPDNASTPRVDLRASFQILHEMLLLKKLVDTIKSSWGPPSQWTMAQYQELVQGISLAQEKAGSSEFGPDSILAEAFKLRYQFEEIPDNQRKLSSDDDPLGAAQPAVERLQNDGLDSPVSTSHLQPERWDEMVSVSRSKRLPQVHVDGLFFGFYDKLEHLEDEEQLRMYFKNPHAAKKLSTVLDSNIILEAFGHATTSMNLNSSRFGKVTTLQISFGLHPWEFQICGCYISPFLLEKSRVTSDKTKPVRDHSDMNFHILYAMVAGVNAFSFMHLLANDLRLDGVDCSAFVYLGRCDHKLAEFMSKEETWKKDVERWQQVIDGLDELNLSPDQQKTIFKVLSAVLWLGNIGLDYKAESEKLVMSSLGMTNAPDRVVELLELGSVGQLERMLTTKSVTLQSTNETFEVTLEKGQVNHVRDSLARLLYQLVFDYIVDAMNEATKSNTTPVDGAKDEFPKDVAVLKIIDVFGFEDLATNSLDQLCINYLSEKLYAREEQVVLAAYKGDAATRHFLDKDKDIIFVYEHPLGVFASLEELTILHQSENETAQQEEKRNILFVRNIYERNPSRLPEPPRVLNNGKRQSTVALTMLPFVIPHTRGNVLYDANEFVKKNSDFVYANLVEGLKTSSSAHFHHMLDVSSNVKTGSESNKQNNTQASRFPASKSFVGQFRSHVNALTTEDEANMPFYFHCIRPNAKKQPSVVAKDLVSQQCRSQRLPQQVQICRDPSSVYSALELSKNTVLGRYGCLLREPYAFDEVTSSNESLSKWLSDLLRSDDCQTPKICVSTSVVKFNTISLVETLELLLEDREAEAATRIQSLFLMIMWRHRYLAKKQERRGLFDELLAWYGSEKKETVKKLLAKYNGREEELRAKLELKKRSKLQEDEAVHQLATDLKSLCLGNYGGLDAQAVNDILHDDGMREMLQQNEKVVLALRDMSLNPDVLESQLTDHELRTFYQKLVDFLRSKKSEDAKQVTCMADNQSVASLDERVAAAASEGNRVVWMRLVQSDEWAAYHDALVEVGDDPELLLFHSEDDDFVATLERFLTAIALDRQREEEKEALAAITHLVRPPTVDEGGVLELQDSVDPNDDDAEVLELLLSVKFGPSLMSAMNQDPYFVQALQDPVLMTSMHQLMANPKDFATSTALRQPGVRGFFLKLIALSFAVQEESGEED